MATTMTCALPTSASSNLNEQRLDEERDWQGALHTLAKFAAMDTLQYASLFHQEPSRPRCGATTQSGEHGNLLLQLEALRKDGNFSETPIPDLVQAIHRFHSNLALWHHQDEQHAQAMRDLQAALAASQDREHRLQQECRRLNKQTTKLRVKLQEKRTVLAKAKTWFRESVAERESLQEIATVAQLQVHEHVLAAPGRIRLESTDSNFSDVDALNFNVESDYTTSEGTDVDFTNQTESAEGSESQSSLVTDEGVATLHFKADESLPRIAATSSSYTLEFPSGIKTGMRVKSVPLSEWAPLAKPALSPLHLEGLESSTSASDEREFAEETTEGFAYVVCGHHQIDSDDESNTKTGPRVALPPTGARILAVRDHNISPLWTISEVLAAMSSTADGKPTFSVTFRNGRVVKSKQQKSLACSDDDSSSQSEKQNGETVPEKIQHRPFSLLQFGKNAASKSKESGSQDTVEQEPANNKPVPQKGTSNPLMFWRNEDKTNEGNQDNLEDLSLEECSGRPEKDAVPEKEPVPKENSLTDTQAEDSKPEPCKADTCNKGSGNPLMFWKKDDSEPRVRKNTADSAVLRLRKNTADSAAITEATLLSKEDSSVYSCSDSKTEECPSFETAEQNTVQQKMTPMNHLMFWRKSEQTQGAKESPSAVETAAKEPEVTEEGSTTIEKTATSEKAAASEMSTFRLPFWNSQARQSKDKGEAAAKETRQESGTPNTDSTEKDKDTVEGVTTETESQEDKDETEVVSGEALTAEASSEPLMEPKIPEKSIEGIPEKKKDDSESSEAVTPSTQALEQGAKETASKDIKADSSTKEEGEQHVEAPTTGQVNGPIMQMSRFFSNPFAN